MPGRWRRGRRRGRFATGSLNRWLVTRKEESAVGGDCRHARGRRRNCRLQGRFRIRMGRQGITEPLRNRLQLPHRHPQADQDHAGAGADHAGQDERAADAELLVLNTVADRQQARHNESNASDQHHHHHRTHPQQPARSCAGCLRHDTVIISASPTANWNASSLKIGGLRAGHPRSHRTRNCTTYELLPNCCIASVNYATIPNYSVMELRYMDAGE